MIDIVFAPPRRGKTCYLTYRANEVAFDNERLRLAKREIELLNKGGFNLSMPFDTVVSSNFPIVFRKFGYSRRHTRIINPYRLGYDNPYVKTHLDIPYGFYVITEAQKYLNSRKSKEYPEWQSRYYEQEGHLNLDFILDTQRPKLIDVNIRELASFSEIVSLDFGKDEFGKIDKLIWKIREMPDNEHFEEYMKSGKKDKDCYEERKVIADFNVFNLYDSRCCKPKFFQGKFNKDFDYQTTDLLRTTKEDFSFYYDKIDDSRPKDFYVKETNTKNISNKEAQEKT